MSGLILQPVRGQYRDTAERKQKIVNYLRMGATRRDSVKAAGVVYQTFLNWLNSDLEFLESVSEAEGECGALMAARIYAEATRAKGDWRAALEWLRRRRRTEWGDKLDVTKLTNEQLIALLEEEDTEGTAEEENADPSLNTDAPES